MNITNRLLDDMCAELMQCAYDWEVWCRENGMKHAVMQKNTIDTLLRAADLLNACKCKREMEATNERR